MSFWNTRDIKSARKPHRCEFCGCKIHPGDSCQSNTGIYDGEFNHYYFCTRCVRFIDLYNLDLSDGFSVGDFYDYIYYAHSCCPKCGSYNHREHTWDDKQLNCKFECDNCDHIWTQNFEFKDDDNGG